MRILHTSDWHLGRSFHGEDLLAAQAAYVDHLIETVETEQVDLVVVAGDVYDRALPPVDAVALADDAFTRLAASRARVVITSGNHDSARRLGFSSRLVDAAGVHLRTDAGRVDEPVLLDDEHGPVAVYGIPYLEPDVLRHAWDLPTRSHHAALAEAMRRIRADLAPDAPGTRSVVLAHAFVAGGLPSESERDIAVGGDLGRPARALRRHRLHRARAPARPRDADRLGPLQRLAARLLVLRGRPRQGLLAGRPRRRRTRGTPGSSRRPSPRRLARLEGTLEELLTDDPPRRARGLLGAGDPHRRRPAGPGDGAAAHPLPARARPALRAGGRRAAARPPDHRGQVRPRDRARLRRPRARGAGEHPRSPTCCARPWSAARRTPTSALRARRGGERLMRLHELSITAFGPFVDTVHVDFDELAAGGVFLLTGDTGAGKTSVLDAVCFALYGEVPGDRHSARHLRSDHADPQAEPRVVLRAQHRRAHLPVHPLPRLGPPQAPRHRHHPGPGPRRRRGAAVAASGSP